ncbi:hypothetical protein PM082_004569 [Marasmius tenuissimus]|nr:hypothetical protein PM082_004569 [Marasmius tenuissimus]
MKKPRKNWRSIPNPNPIIRNFTQTPHYDFQSVDIPKSEDYDTPLAFPDPTTPQVDQDARVHNFNIGAATSVSKSRSLPKTSTERSRIYRAKISGKDITLGNRRDVVKSEGFIHHYPTSAIQPGPSRYQSLVFTLPITPNSIWRLSGTFVHWGHKSEGTISIINPCLLVQNNIQEFYPKLEGERWPVNIRSPALLQQPDNVTILSIDLPGSTRGEDFPLMEPKSKKFYSPIKDLESTARSIYSALKPRIASQNAKYLDRLEEALKTTDKVFILSAMDSLNQFLRRLERQDFRIPLSYMILRQAYDRCVTPCLKPLGKYKPFSAETYGEILPEFVHHILMCTRLTSGSVVVDLGCGVGNVITQISMEVGCKAFGIEIRDTAFTAARTFVNDAVHRASLWGVPVGHVEVVQGDLRNHPKIMDVLPSADLIIINNRTFDAALNHDILKLIGSSTKSSVVIISLIPLEIAGNLRSGKTIHDARLLTCRQEKYHADWVSWTSKVSEYYVQGKAGDNLNWFSEG